MLPFFSVFDVLNCYHTIDHVSPQSWVFLYPSLPFSPSNLTWYTHAIAESGSGSWTVLSWVHFIFMQFITRWQAHRRPLPCWWLLYIKNLAQCLEQSRFHPGPCFSLAILLLISYGLLPSALLSSSTFSYPVSASFFLCYLPLFLLSFFFLIPSEEKFIPSISYKPDIALFSSSCYVYAKYQF